MYIPGFFPHSPPPQIFITLMSRPSYDWPMTSVETVSGNVSVGGGREMIGKVVGTFSHEQNKYMYIQLGISLARQVG